MLLICSHFFLRYAGENWEISIDFDVDRAEKMSRKKKAKMRENVVTLKVTVYSLQLKLT